MEETEILMNKLVYLGLSIPEFIKYLCMSFNMIMQNQNMKRRQNCVIWTQIVSLYT